MVACNYGIGMGNSVLKPKNHVFASRREFDIDKYFFDCQETAGLPGIEAGHATSTKRTQRERRRFADYALLCEICKVQHVQGYAKLLARGLSMSSGAISGGNRTRILQEGLLDAKVPEQKTMCLQTSVDVANDNDNDDNNDGDSGEKFDEVAEVVGKTAAGYDVIRENGEEDTVSRGCIPDDVFEAHTAAMRVDERARAKCLRNNGKCHVVEIEPVIAPSKSTRVCKVKCFGVNFVIERIDNGDGNDDDDDGDGFNH
jgi:hypothetical protein